MKKVKRLFFFNTLYVCCHSCFFFYLEMKDISVQLWILVLAKGEYPYIKVTGCQWVCLSVTLFVSKDLANHWTYMIFLLIELLNDHWKVYVCFFRVKPPCPPPPKKNNRRRKNIFSFYFFPFKLKFCVAWTNVILSLKDNGSPVYEKIIK